MNLRKYSSFLIAFFGLIVVLLSSVYGQGLINVVATFIGCALILFGILRIQFGILKISKRIDSYIRNDSKLSKDVQQSISRDVAANLKKMTDVERYSKESRRLAAAIDSRTRRILGRSEVEEKFNNDTLEILSRLDSSVDLILDKVQKQSIHTSKVENDLAVVHKVSSTIDFRTRRIFEHTSAGLSDEMVANNSGSIAELLELSKSELRNNKVMSTAARDGNHQIGRGFTNVVSGLQQVALRLDLLEKTREVDHAIHWQVSHRTLLSSLGVLAALASSPGYLETPQSLMAFRQKILSCSAGDLVINKLSESVFFELQSSDSQSRKLYVVCTNVGVQELVTDVANAMNVSDRLTPVLRSELSEMMNQNGVTEQILDEDHSANDAGIFDLQALLTRGRS